LFVSDLQARHKAVLEQTEAKYEALIAERNLRNRTELDQLDEKYKNLLAD